MKETEIERRFLLKYLPDLKYSEKIGIRQVYTSIGERYRESFTNELNGPYYDKIIKKSVSPGINTEEVFKLSREEFSKVLVKGNKIIYKVRHIFIANDLKFEIDLFQSPNNYQPCLIICEVELLKIDQEIKFPKKIKEAIILEITEFKQFSNYNLSSKITC